MVCCVASNFDWRESRVEQSCRMPWMRWRVSGFESVDDSDAAMFLIAVVSVLGGKGG